MSAKELFIKTLPFVWAKLLLGLIFLGAAVILLGIFFGIGSLFGEGSAVILVLLWLICISILNFVLMHYFGYMVKAGHVAVIAEATVTGRIPENQVEYGKEKVKERFKESNVYFFVDSLVTGAVKQIQKGISKIGDMLNFIPGMGFITQIVQTFIGIYLGYIDECCLGWTFINPNNSAFKSAADGVVIYAQNWKELLKDAAKTMLKVAVLCIVAVVIIFIPIVLIFNALNWSPIIAFIIACVATWVIKFGFLDSYIMVEVMASYMNVAQNTEITYDLYDKLCKLSGKFKQLFNKGQEEEPIGNVAYATGERTNTNFDRNTNRDNINTDVYCSECGTKNSSQSKFCTNCGKEIRK